MRSTKASSKFAQEVEMISRWLSSALPPEFNDEKLFMTAHGRDARRLPIVQDITKNVELLKVKVEKWKAKSQAARMASAKASEDFARMIFEDIQRNVTALVNIEASWQAAAAICSSVSLFSLSRAHTQVVYEPDKWRGFHPEAKSFWKFFEGAWQVSPPVTCCCLSLVVCAINIFYFPPNRIAGPF
jgi:hypothetical protein